MLLLLILMLLYLLFVHLLGWLMMRVVVLVLLATCLDASAPLVQRAAVEVALRLLARGRGARAGLRGVRVAVHAALGRVDVHGGGVRRVHGGALAGEPPDHRRRRRSRTAGHVGTLGVAVVVYHSSLQHNSTVTITCYLRHHTYSQELRQQPCNLPRLALPTSPNLDATSPPFYAKSPSFNATSPSSYIQSFYCSITNTYATLLNSAISFCKDSSETVNALKYK